MASVAPAPTRQLLADRAKWYAAGCPDLEDNGGYQSSGDLAKDAGSDLSAALAYSEQNEQVAREMLADADIYQERAIRSGTTTAVGRVQMHAAERLRSWAKTLNP